MTLGSMSYLLTTITGQGLRLFRELSGAVDSGRACCVYDGFLLRRVVLCGGKGRAMHAVFMGGYRKLRYEEFR